MLCVFLAPILHFYLLQVRLHNTTQDVDSSLCEDAGLETPATIRKCGSEECPVWITTPWTRCSESRCFNKNTAMQRRDVKCQIANKTNVDNSLCNEHDKPTHRQECYNEKCKGVWKVGHWFKVWHIFLIYKHLELNASKKSRDIKKTF